MGEVKEKKELKLDKTLKFNSFKNLFKKLVNNTELDRRSNLRSLWVLNERLVEAVEYKNSFETYPAVAFVGNISEMIE